MIRRLWDVQWAWNPWFSLGVHFDHTDPSLTFHLPGVIVALGRLKQPGFRHSLRRIVFQGGMMIKIGDVARDTITSFEGFVIARTDWLNGCSRFLLQPRGLREGKIIEAEWFDDTQLEIVESKDLKRDVSTGGPRPDPARSW